jgi:hypothetical protein
MEGNRSLNLGDTSRRAFPLMGRPHHQSARPARETEETRHNGVYPCEQFCSECIQPEIILSAGRPTEEGAATMSPSLNFRSLPASPWTQQVRRAHAGTDVIDQLVDSSGTLVTRKCAVSNIASIINALEATRTDLPRHRRGIPSPEQIIRRLLSPLGSI